LAAPPARPRTPGRRRPRGSRDDTPAPPTLSAIPRPARTLQTPPRKDARRHGQRPRRVGSPPRPTPHRVGTSIRCFSHTPRCQRTRGSRVLPPVIPSPCRARPARRHGKRLSHLPLRFGSGIVLRLVSPSTVSAIFFGRLRSRGSTDSWVMPSNQCRRLVN
jgi:hypothetical protein